MSIDTSSSSPAMFQMGLKSVPVNKRSPQPHNSAQHGATTTTTTCPIITTPPPQQQQSREVKELWSSTLQCLYNEMKEIGKALTCSICQATFHQPVLLPCVHAFCKDCLTQSLRLNRKCPICRSKATTRSFMDAPFLEGVAHSYKELLRSLGMTPIVYDESVGMTQLPASPDDYGDGDDDEEEEGDDDMEDIHHHWSVGKQPHFRGSKTTPSLLECSEHLALSRLWQQAFLQEREQLPPNSDLERKKLSSLLQDQNNVVAADERVLIRAATVRHARGKKQQPTLPPPNERTPQNVTTRNVVNNDDGIEHSDAQSMTRSNRNTPSEDNKKQKRPKQSQPKQAIPGLVTNPQKIIHGENDDSKKPRAIPVPCATHQMAMKSGGQLTVSQQVDEECMEEARDQHTADRSDEWEDIVEDKDDNGIPSNGSAHKTTATIIAAASSDRFAFSTAETALVSTANATSGKSTWLTKIGKRTKKYGQQRKQKVTTMTQGSNAQNVALIPEIKQSWKGKGLDSDELQPFNNDQVSSTANTPNTAIPEEDESGKLCPSVESGNKTTMPEVQGPASDFIPGPPEPGFADSCTQPRRKQGHNKATLKSNRDNTEEPSDESPKEEVNVVAQSTVDENKQNSKPPGPIVDDKPNVGDMVDHAQASSDVEASNDAIPTNDESNTPTPNVGKSGEECNTSAVVQDVESETSQPKDCCSEGPSRKFSVGDIVEVQRRTWSGINKPGGTARVTKVYDEGSYFYDVAYVLGGRERKVDASFVAAPTNLGLDNTVADTGKKSKRLEPCIPPELLAQLSAEGFDTKGLGCSQSSTASRKRKMQSQVMDGVDKKQAKSSHRERQKKNCQGKERSGLEIKNDPNKVEDEGATLEKENEENSASEKLASVTDRSKRPHQDQLTSISKRCKTSEEPIVSESKESSESTESIAALQALTPAEKCKYADAAYIDLFNNALQEATITVVCSGLAEADKKSLEYLCKASKKSGVKLKLTETFHPEKNTLCVVAAEQQSGSNLVPRIRTLKTMRAALAGIPIVDSGWVKACQQTKKVGAPTPAMFVRSLPTKTNDLDKDLVNYGVSALAARLRLAKQHGTSTSRALPLHGVSVFLCGSFKTPKKTDIQILLRESGCSIIVSSAATVAKLNSPSHDDDSNTIVMLCDDETSSNHCGISKSLARTVTACIEHAKRNVIVVNTQWLFDCITCCDLLPPGCYPPCSALARDIWAKTIKP